MKKIIALSFAMFEIVFLAGCGQQPVSQTQPTTSAPALAVQQPAQPVTTSSDYQTYKNDKYSFEFNRPKKWEIDTERTSANAVVFVDKSMAAGMSREAVSFEPNSNNLSLDQAVSEFAKERDYTEQQINSDYQVKIGGEKTVQIETNEFGLTLYMFVHKGTIFTIETQNLFSDDVLKTFKFTN